MVGRGGRYGSMRVIGMAFFCARRSVPLFLCWPPASRSSCAALFPLVHLLWCFVFLFGFFADLPLLSRSSLLICALRVPPAPLCATPVSPPRALTPCLVMSPLLSAVTPRVLPVFFRPPSLPLPCFHSCAPPVCSTPAPLCRPYPFPWWLTYPCALPSFPDSLPFRDARGHFEGGGGVTSGLELQNCTGQR